MEFESQNTLKIQENFLQNIHEHFPQQYGLEDPRIFSEKYALKVNEYFPKIMLSKIHE